MKCPGFSGVLLQLQGKLSPTPMPQGWEQDVALCLCVLLTPEQQDLDCVGPLIGDFYFQ